MVVEGSSLLSQDNKEQDQEEKLKEKRGTVGTERQLRSLIWSW